MVTVMDYLSTFQTVKFMISPITKDRLKCTFCGGDIYALSPIIRDDKRYSTFRCFKCNVKFEIANPSYLDYEIRKIYDYLVDNELLGQQ